MNYTSEFSSFVVALHDKDLKQVDNVVNNFHSECRINGDEVACAFYDIATKNKHFKKLKAESFIETNFNKKIDLA
jgi:hypothetical protein